MMHRYLNIWAVLALLFIYFATAAALPTPKYPWKKRPQTVVQNQYRPPSTSNLGSGVLYAIGLGRMPYDGYNGGDEGDY